MKKILFYIITFCVSMHSFAQNASSPYSIIGIGDIEKSYFDRTSGLGHAGIALSSNRYMISANPASIVVLDTQYFNFEVAARYKEVTYSGTPITNITDNQSNDLQFKRVALGIKLNKSWAISLGLMPFSSSSYSFKGVKTVQGSPFTAATYNEGNGNSNLVYLTNSFAIAKNLRIGIQSSFFFGQFEQKEYTLSSVSDSILITGNNAYMNNAYFKAGLQYDYAINKKWNISLGATGSLNTKINTTNHVTVKDGNTTLLDNENYKVSDFILPQMYTLGLAATYQNKYTFVADYNFQNWSKTNISGVGYALVNSDRISAGVQYTKNVALTNGANFEHHFFQAGFFYNNSYLQMNGRQLTDVGVTVGAGVQLLRSGLGVHAVAEFGQRGTTDLGLIKENYTQFGLTISYRDFWFTKKRRYD